MQLYIYECQQLEYLPDTPPQYLQYYVLLISAIVRSDAETGPKFIKTAQGQRAKVKLQGSKGQSLYVRGIAASLKDVKGESNTYSSCESDL